MRKAIIATLLVLTLPAIASARFAPWSSISFVGGAGVGIPLNDDGFQGNYKEALYSTLRVESEIFKNVSVYGDYDSQTFDVEAGAEGDPIETSSFGVGAMVFGNLNSFGTVRGYVELGASGNTSGGQDKTWFFQPGVGIDFNLDDSGQSGLRLGVRWRNYDDEPERIQAVMPLALLRISPGK